MTALDLGSGNGFLSICLAAIAGDILSELVITDMEDHLALIERTVCANSHIITKEHEDDGGNSKKNKDDCKVNANLQCCVMEHRWGEFQSSKHQH